MEEIDPQAISRICMDGIKTAEWLQAVFCSHDFAVCCYDEFLAMFSVIIIIIIITNLVFRLCLGY